VIDSYRVGEPEDEDDGATVIGPNGQEMTADEIVQELNKLERKAMALDADLQTIARHRDEYRERAYTAEGRFAAPQAGCECPCKDDCDEAGECLKAMGMGRGSWL
jgi:hypothetical protein